MAKGDNYAGFSAARSQSREAVEVFPMNELGQA